MITYFFPFLCVKIYVAAFVAKMFLREDILLENVNTSPKTKVTSALEKNSDNGMGAECSVTNVEDEGINSLAGIIFCRYKHYVLLTQFDVELRMSYFSIKLFDLKFVSSF